jgi:hypothetical protein
MNIVFLHLKLTKNHPTGRDIWKGSNLARATGYRFASPLICERKYLGAFLLHSLRRTGDYGAKAPIAGPNPPEASK